jgi:O-antigen/teichoic acid export membrane protein
MLNIGVGLSGVTLAMVGHSRLHLANNLLALTSSFGLGIVLIPGFGIVGAAATQAISRGVVNLLAVFELYFLLHIHPYERAIIKPIIAGILAALAVYPLKTMLVGANTLFSLMLLASVFGALYLMLLYFLKLAPQDYQALSLVGKMLWLSRPRWK